MSRVSEPLRQALAAVRHAPVRARREAASARRRTEERLEQRVRTVRSRQELLQEAETRRASTYRYGYLVCRGGSSVPSKVAKWVRREVGTVTYHLHPSTRMTVAAGVVVLIGDPVDVDAATTDARAIAERLAGLQPEGTAAIVHSASRLGGRWTLVVHEADGGLTVVTDALASQDVWWPSGASRSARHGTLIASHRRLLPAARTSSLRPNTLLRIEPLDGDGVGVHRYWPAPEDAAGAAVAPEPAGRELGARLVTHTRLLATLGRPGIALTEGVASRAVLAAYLQHPRDDGFACTTFEVASVGEGLGPVEHLFAASQLAQTLGLPHRVVEELAPSDADGLGLAYAQTYPEGTRLGLARAYAALPVDAVVLHPGGADLTDRTAWETGDQLRSAAGFAEAELTHRVLLPFNDRRIIELLLSLAAAPDDAPSPLATLADELPRPTPALDA